MDYKLDLNEHIGLHSTMLGKAKEESSPKPFCEIYSGFDPTRNSEKLMVIDRRNEKYLKVIINPETGKEVYRCEEPLPEHQGRGSAHRG